MSAIHGYERLESPGLWRPSPDEQRREVIVSIGEATLVISDHAERTLAHWSLAALVRLNPGTRPALYSPGDDAADTLEIGDETMIDALGKVQRTIARGTPHPGRLRAVLLSVGLVGVVALGALWLPDALIRQATAIVPPAQRAAIGERMLDHIRRVAGAPCTTPRGNRALAALQDRLLGTDAQGRLIVLPDGVPESASLPGGTILLNRALVEDYEDPEVLSGFILAEDARRQAIDPMARLLAEAGSITALRLLATGDLPDAALASHAEDLLSSPEAPVSEDTLLARFQEAGVPSSPYAYARDISGETTLGLIEADPGRPAEALPLLEDGDWISLQGICID